MKRTSPDQPTILLGRDHVVYGEYECIALPGNRTVAAISVGADPRSPGLSSKGSMELPNEDALLAIERGGLTLMAVADAHFGWHASHDLIAALARRSEEIPDNPEQLEQMIASLEPTGEPDGSWSTLLIAIYDRRARHGFGISFGDSSLVVVGAGGAYTANFRGFHYVNLHDPASLRASEGLGFRFFAETGQLVLAFTDGINECHYRSPETSIGHRHLEELFGTVGADPLVYARRLMEMALGGVDGNPGGQDNIALVLSVA